MAFKDLDIGAVSAYALAVEHGYTGTEEEWATEQAEAGNNARAAREAADDSRAYEQACKEILESVQSAVAEAGAAQVQAVEDKGAEVMYSVAAVGAEQVSAVQAASESSKTAIEQKTDEQLARIPEVTELAEDVGSLNEAMADLESVIDSIITGHSSLGLVVVDGMMCQTYEEV